MSSKKSHQQNQKRLQQLFTLQAQNTLPDREKRLMYFKEEFSVKRHRNRYYQYQNDQNHKSACTTTTVLVLFIFAIILNVGTCFFAGQLAQCLRDYARYSVKEKLIN